MRDATLVAGPDADATTDRALEWAADSAGRHPNAVLCVTQSDSRATAIEARWNEDHDPLRICTTTLDEFVGDCYERATGNLAGSRLTRVERLRLVEATIQQYETDSGPLATIDDPSDDLVDQVQGVFSLLEFAGYATPEAIDRALRRAGIEGSSGLAPELYASFRNGDADPEASPLAVQAETIAGLYEEYQRLRSELHPEWKVARPEQYHRLLENDALVKSLPSTVDAVVLHGLTRLAPAEREAVARIARSVPTVAAIPLVHPSVGGVGLDRGVERSLRVYQAIGFELAYEVPARVDDDRLRALRSVHSPARDPPTFPAPEVGFEWTTPATERQEVRRVARRVRARLADGVDPAEIGVVVSDPSAYRGLLDEVFSSYDLPLTFPNGTSLEQTHVGCAIDGLLDLVEDSPLSADGRARHGDGRTHHGDLGSLCANPLVTFGEGAVDTGLVAAVTDPNDDLESQLADVEASDPESATVLREFLERLTEETDDLAGFLASVREGIETLGVERAVREANRAGGSTGSYRPAVERSAVNCVDTVLSTLEHVAAGVPDHDHDDPAGAVRRALRAELVSAPGQEPGYVRVLPLTDAESRSFEHLFVIGLTASYFPAEQDAMAFFDAINDADEEFGRAHTGRRARYILGTLLGGSNQVVLSTPEQSIDGTEHVPAPVATELQQYIEPAERSNDDGDGSTVPPIASEEDRQRAFASWAARQQFDDPTTATAVLDGADWSADAERFGRQGLELAWRRSRPELTPHDGRLEDTVDAVFPAADRGPYSPSALEEYARCPFRFMCTDVLNFDDEWDEDAAISRADRGSYVHAVLAAFYRELRTAAHEPVDLETRDRDELEAILLDCALDELDTLGAVGRPGAPSTDEDPPHGAPDSPFARRTLTRLLSGLGTPEDNPYYAPPGTGRTGGNTSASELKSTTVSPVRGTLVRFLDAELEAHDADRARPTYLEAGIGVDREGVEPLSDDPVEIETPSGTVTVRGIADRVDVTSTEPRGVYVVDYKTGRSPSTTDVTTGSKLQLPLYGLALERLLEEATGIEHETLGGSYYSLQAPDAVDPNSCQITSQAVAGGTDDPPVVPPAGSYWFLPFEERSEVEQFVHDVTPDRLGTIATAIENGAFHTTLQGERDARCDQCSFSTACDVRHQHRRDVVETVDDATHYVPECVTGDELDLDAYGRGGGN